MVDAADVARRALAEQEPQEAFDTLCAEQTLPRADAYNRVALAIAREFDAGRATFEAADGAINWLWGLMVADKSIEGPFPEPTHSIYEAFDRGEYTTCPGEDPVSTYTTPEIGRLLRDAGGCMTERFPYSPTLGAGTLGRRR